MCNNIYGYIRVSTKNQNTQRQLNAFFNYGISEDDIFIDYASGSTFDRPSYKLLKATVKKGDTIVFMDLSRFGRNEKENKKEYKYFKKKGVNLEFLNRDYDTFDTDEKYIHNISKFYEMELNTIKSRQRDGIDNMPRNENGKRYSLKTGREHGRPKRIDSDELIEYMEAYLNDEMTVSEILEKTGMTQPTLYRRISIYKKEKEKNNIHKNKNRPRNNESENDGILYINIY